MGQYTTGSDEGAFEITNPTEDVENIGMQQVLDDDSNRIEDETSSTEPSFYLSADFLPKEFCDMSQLLTRDIIMYICEHENPCPPENKAVRIMRSLVDDALVNRLNFMKDLVDKLDLSTLEDLVVLDRLVTEMFDDDTVTWGRIVTLFSFSGYLARHCEQSLEISGSAEAVAERLTNILIGRLGLWIVTNGGWEAFQNQFPAICIFETTQLWKFAGYIFLLCGGAFAFYSSLQMLNAF